VIDRLEKRAKRLLKELETIMTTPKTNGGPPQGQVLYNLRGATKTYGSGSVLVRAIDGIDLEIRQGEFVVIVGPSGSGKSTMLQLLGALDRPSGGTIEFEGRDLGHQGDRQLAELRLKTLGFIFQQFNLIPTLSAQENVEVALAPRGLSATERAGTAQEMLARVKLGERGSHLPSQLSGGEQQRVAIARALANRPDVLLADEPTGNLDTKTGQTILDLLYELWMETGLTVVLITHDQAIADRAPRVVRLADGHVASDERQTVEMAAVMQEVGR
jgi:putative ABC transport system ATP-binding protein